MPLSTKSFNIKAHIPAKGRFAPLHSDLHPATRKTRVFGDPRPAAARKEFLFDLLRGPKGPLFHQESFRGHKRAPLPPRASTSKPTFREMALRSAARISTPPREKRACSGTPGLRQRGKSSFLIFYAALKGRSFTGSVDMTGRSFRHDLQHQAPLSDHELQHQKLALQRRRSATMRMGVLRALARRSGGRTALQGRVKIVYDNAL
jgi:hypothetical protein